MTNEEIEIKGKFLEKFTNQTAIITGAGSGMGQQLAIVLATQNCNLALVDISSNGLTETVNKINNPKLHITQHVADLANLDDIHRISDEIKSAHKEITMICNFAGIAAGGSFLEIEESTIERLTRVNFLSQAYLLKAFLQQMKELKKSYVINMSSVTGLIAMERQSIYAATKHAVRGLSHVLFYELENTGIQISVIYPGAVNTGIVRHAIKLDGDNRKYSSITNGIAPRAAILEILKGVAKGKRDIIIGNDARKVLFIQKLFPIKYWNITKNAIDM